MTYDAVTVPTPFGAFTAIADDGTVVGSGFTAGADELRDRLPDPGAEIRVRTDLGLISSALDAYFAGADATAIDRLPGRMEGGPAMRRLWDELRRIPAGEVRSYAQLGGDRRHARAAGSTCARTPVPLIVPCHRVVRTDGSLGGFGWGLPLKRWLLDHEAAAMGRRPEVTAAACSPSPDAGDQPGPPRGPCPPFREGLAEETLLVVDPSHLEAAEDRDQGDRGEMAVGDHHRQRREDLADVEGVANEAVGASGHQLSRRREDAEGEPEREQAPDGAGRGNHQDHRADGPHPGRNGKDEHAAGERGAAQKQDRGSEEGDEPRQDPAVRGLRLGPDHEEDARDQAEGGEQGLPHRSAHHRQPIDPGEVGGDGVDDHLVSEHGVEHGGDDPTHQQVAKVGEGTAWPLQGDPREGEWGSRGAARASGVERSHAGSIWQALPRQTRATNPDRKSDA